MSFKKAVVLGAGPVGLLCAIHARQHFCNTVVVVDKRSTYTRTNVPALDTDIRKHFTKLGVDNRMGITNQGSQASFSKIEEALCEKAEAIGCKVLRSRVCSSLIGLGTTKGGRFKSMSLYLAAWDEKQKKKLIDQPALREECDLLIIASGGGASADSIVIDTLGFTFEKLSAENYGAFGIFEKKGERLDMSPNLKGAGVATKEIANFTIRFETADHNYLLTTLTGCSQADYKLLTQSTVALKDLLKSIRRGAYGQYVEDLKEVEKNVGLFTIAIQRARQMCSPRYPAVLVGDAAVTPHPEKGSGYTTGFRGFEELVKLLEALKKTHRSKDNSVVFQSFNDRYELHVSRKAIEGTAAVLSNVQKMLKNYSTDMQRGIDKMTNKGAKEYVKFYKDRADKLFEEVGAQSDLAKKYYEYLQGDIGQIPPEFEWDMTVGRLWGWVDATWNDINELTKNVELLSDRLDGLKGQIR